MTRVCLKSDWSFLKAINKVFFGRASPFQTLKNVSFTVSGCRMPKKNSPIFKSEVTINWWQPINWLIKSRQSLSIVFHFCNLTLPWRAQTPSCRPARVWRVAASWREPAEKAGERCFGCRGPDHKGCRTGSTSSSPLWAVALMTKHKIYTMSI